MQFYEVLSGLMPRTSYLAKILMVSFIGVHIPMIGAVVYVVSISDMPWMQSIGVLVAILIATLLGTLATMGVLYALLRPVTQAANALRSYLHDRSLPELPVHHRDEAGLLLANVQEAVTRLDTALTAIQAKYDGTVASYREKFGLIAGMSHDFRTPLNHVIGFAEIISAEALGPIGSKNYQGYASNIGQSGAELLETLQAVLEFSATEANGETMPLQRTALWDPFERAAKLSHRRIGGLGGRIVTDAQDASPAMTFSNARLLAQVAAHAMDVAVPQGASAKELRIARPALGKVVLDSDVAWSRAELQSLSADSVRRSEDLIAANDDAFQVTSTGGLRVALLNSLVKAANGNLALSSNPLGGRRLELAFPLA